MPEQQMTGHELAALCLRILGVVILLSGLAQAVFMAFGIGQWELFLGGLVAGLASLVVIGAMALPLIFHSETLVSWVFPKSDRTIAFAVTRRDLLACGLFIVGAWLLATNLPYLARIGVEVLWYAEGERRAALGMELSGEFFENLAFDALGAVFAAAAGWVLFRHARNITDWWESKSGGGSRRPQAAPLDPPES